MNVETQLPTTRERLYARSRRSIPAAREFTRETLATWNADVPLDDVLLCVSELTTNALLHGVPPGRYFLLRLRPHGAAGVRVEVHDSGPGTLPVVPAARENGGRGLLLVAALAAKWGAQHRHPGKVVWCEFG
ncbi:ATP-binding protein [Streptomyces roseirectus]|uniref:ATP-binding protein n=1 Tax=Streptomyces roseirectus TaxID=2768066 RepID=A0A7H0IFF3_9ACTN|nr:ATP-binding protein [Streptomyces roseirectus]QNP71519.1 ATP-binding protein [Streptomyces roseirectus]